MEPVAARGERWVAVMTSSLVYPRADGGRGYETFGSYLSASDRAWALVAFPHRYTGEHKPAWANKLRLDGRPYRPQYRDDNEWLAKTRFRCTRNGVAIRSAQACWSTDPSWPEGRG